MPHVLHKLKIDEIAFVDAGAGKGVKVRLYKRASAEEKSPMTSKIQKALEFLKLAKPDTKEAIKVIEALKAESDKAGSLDDVMAALSPELQETLSEFIASLQSAPKDGDKAEDEDEDKADDEDDKAEDDEDEDKAADEDEDKADDDEEDEDKKAMKSLPKAARKMIEKALDRAEKAEKLADAESRKRRHSDLVEVLKATKNVPGDIEKRADMLLKIEDTDPKAYAELLKSLKGAHAIIAKSNFGAEIGSAGHGDAGDASLSMQSMADEAFEKADGKMTKEQAYAKVWKKETKLRQEMVAERRAN